MREIRMSGSEGGGTGKPTGPPYPYRSVSRGREGLDRIDPFSDGTKARKLAPRDQRLEFIKRRGVLNLRRAPVTKDVRAQSVKSDAGRAGAKQAAEAGESSAQGLDSSLPAH